VVITDPSSEYVIAAMFGGVRRENPLWTARLDDLLAGRPEWKPVAAIADEVINVTFRGDDLWLLTTRDAENGKLLRTRMSTPDLAGAEVVIPEGNLVIETLGAAADALYVTQLDGGYQTLFRIRGGEAPEPIALPFEGSIPQLSVASDAPGAYLRLTSWLEPSGVWRLDADGRVTDTGLAPKPDIDTSPYEFTRDFATARDGTRVPVSIISRKGAPRDGSNPTMVEAYGAYQVVSSPGFDTRGIALLEKGGVQVVAPLLRLLLLLGLLRRLGRLAGLLLQTANKHPDVSQILKDAVGQVQAIAQVYGLQVGWPGVATFPGLPATASPVGRSPDGLPLGIQVIGTHLHDLTTIAIAAWLAEVV
jgi:prolyl oligopeptidase